MRRLRPVARVASAARDGSGTRHIRGALRRPWIAAYHSRAGQATSTRNGEVLRGLILARALSPDDAFAQTLGDVAVRGGEEGAEDVGPGWIKVFNALLTRGHRHSPAALAQLSPTPRSTEGAAA